MDVFFEMPCLTEKSAVLNGMALQKKWFKSADKRIIGQYLQKFIHYNSLNFDFLGLQTSIVGSDQTSSIYFRSTQFIGAIPLRAPDTGKQIGDLIVKPRFGGNNVFQDYIEILNYLKAEVEPKIIDSLPLASGNDFKPPMYLAAIKFIDRLEILMKLNWRKFSSQKKTTDYPVGQVDWNKYLKNEYKVEKRLKFPVTKNILSEFHSEFSQIKYVFELSSKEILSSQTPLRIKNFYRTKLDFIEKQLYFHRPERSNEIKIKTSDSPIINSCKREANNLLKNDFQESTAWRIDFSDVFEKLIQKIFQEVARETGGQLFSNYRFTSKTVQSFSWELKYIEPDAIYKKGNFSLFIDAKYKSNFYNKFNGTDKLKEDYRHDLHQIMAYSSFSNQEYKNAALCYPAQQIEFKKSVFQNSINGTKISIMLIGIPVKTSAIPKIKKLLMEKLKV